MIIVVSIAVVQLVIMHFFQRDLMAVGINSDVTESKLRFPVSYKQRRWTKPFIRFYMLLMKFYIGFPFSFTTKQEITKGT